MPDYVVVVSIQPVVLGYKWWVEVGTLKTSGRTLALSSAQRKATKAVLLFRAVLDDEAAHAQ